uniref:Ankyrin repeat and zinc finger domain-containing protein 1 n=1 Tax=Cacopsylla melanoneura TaxID=428564 RepID=A0A8D9DWN0_9HEMI
MSTAQPSLTLKFGSEEYTKAVKNITILKPLNQNKNQEPELRIVDKENVQSKHCSARSMSPAVDVSIAVPPGETGNSLYCSHCEELFENTAQQRKHYKQDWHRYNLKLRLASRPAITEEKFDQLADDVSSISGSDNEDEEVETLGFQLHRQAKILFENSKGQVISMFRCLLYDKKETQPTDTEIISLAQTSVEEAHWFILMLSGGHFAAAVFKNGEPVLHKTFHCYTVRAKQGGSQSTKDNKGNHPKSAGASLRRYNETALVQHVQELLSAWAEDIEKCSLILYRANGPTNRQVLFGGKEPPLNKADPRLRSIPFPTRRPTFTQLKYVHNMLCTVHVYNSVDVLTTVVEPKPRRDPVQSKKSHIDRSKSRPSPDRQLPNHVQELVDIQTPSGSESDVIHLIQEVQEVSFHDLKEMDNSFENENKTKRKTRRKKKKPSSDEPKHIMALTRKLLNAVDCTDDDKLGDILEEIKEACTEEEYESMLNKAHDSNKNTLLHLAAKSAHTNNIKLLLSLNASPCCKDFMSRTAYDLAPDRDSRNVFRRYMAEYPDQFDYSKSHIPSPLTDEIEQDSVEKKRIARKIKREKDKEKKKVEEVIQKEKNEKVMFLKLSDREKMALAAERRILAASGNAGVILTRCFQCAIDMSGKLPFTYNEYRFCSMQCLKQHRLTHPTLEI